VRRNRPPELVVDQPQPTFGHNVGPVSISASDPDAPCPAMLLPGPGVAGQLVELRCEFLPRIGGADPVCRSRGPL